MSNEKGHLQLDYIFAVLGNVASAETLQLEGSTTVGPIANAFAEYFMRLYPRVTIRVKKTGSADGAAALADGRCDIANMSRFMKEKEFKSAVAHGIFPVAHVVAMDGVCVIVHPFNPLALGVATSGEDSRPRHEYSGRCHLHDRR